MEFNEFAEKVAESISGILGEGYRAEIRKIRKNNNITLNGLVIKSPFTNIYPSISLESFFHEYENGKENMEETVGRIIQAYKETEPAGDFDTSAFLDYGKAR